MSDLASPGSPFTLGRDTPPVGEGRAWLDQVILRAMRLALIPPAPVPGACPDHVLAAGLDGIDLETAAVVLVHLAGDVLQDEAGAGQDGPWGAATPAAMDMIANNVFNDRDDDGDLIARYRMLWLDYGARLIRHVPRRPPAEMLREAAGIGLDDMLALACHYRKPVKVSGPGELVRVSVAGPVGAEISIDKVGVFLGIFGSSPHELTAELGRRPLPWQMAPRLVGGQCAFFTEEDLQAAFPGSKSCDAGIDYGADVVLAEVMSGTA